MPSGYESLLAGRSTKPLTDGDVRSVTNTLLGLDDQVPFRHGPGERTRCRVRIEGGEEHCEVVFDADIYPGTSSVDPNASLSMRAALAHELSHYHRWKDKMELLDDELRHLDEALTSLDAARRYGPKLYPEEIQQLVGDAMQRLILFHRTLVGSDEAIAVAEQAVADDAIAEEAAADDQNKAGADEDQVPE